MTSSPSTANDGNIVEVTPGGAQTVKTLIHERREATCSAWRSSRVPTPLYFVNDGNNTLDLFSLLFH